MHAVYRVDDHVPVDVGALIRIGLVQMGQELNRHDTAKAVVPVGISVLLPMSLFQMPWGAFAFGARFYSLYGLVGRSSCWLGN